jgi:hypothetical protein
MWQKPFINTIILAVVFTFRLSAQSDLSKSDVSLSDTLQFTIKQVRVDTIHSKITYTNINPKLVYDFKSQYPYYQTEGKKWKTGDQVQFYFSQLPSKGILYVFSVDGSSTPEILPEIKLDRTINFPIVYPDTLKALTFKVTGTERICIWYAPKPVPNVEKLIMGIELTMGNFAHRNNGQLGNRLVLPSYGWNFNDKQFGFATNTTAFQFAENNILPIIIECDVPLTGTSTISKISNLTPIKKAKKKSKLFTK